MILFVLKRLMPIVGTEKIIRVSAIVLSADTLID